MKAIEVQEHVRKRPFVPIRIFLSDGAKHDVRHPEFIFGTQRETGIGLPSQGDEIPERSVYIAPIHITRIEPINGKRHAKPRTRPELQTGCISQSPRRRITPAETMTL